MEKNGIKIELLLFLFTECLMILVADTRDFEPKADETFQALADQFKINITQVYIWSKVRPVAVEEKLALKFVACISEAIR